jgi:uncharacterized protein (TIGR00661 family)
MHLLIAALNWGMGHASRTVPLIRAFQERGMHISLASDGVAADLFRAEFPDLEVHELPSYKVSYPSSNIYLNVLLSAWNILTAKQKEKRWLKTFRITHKVDAVISDNRYGLRAKDIPCVLITHQLQLYGEWSWANKIGEFIIRRWIRKFTEVWVPDWQGTSSLTGGMATWKYTQPPVRYIGPISRFQVVEHGQNKDLDIVAILSGPEPQRTWFEQKIREQLVTIEGQHLLIRGTKETADLGFSQGNNLKIIDFLPAAELQHWVNRSKMQVSRSGYSTVMDLVYSGIPALMVPTPGQFEQEFLCTFLQGKGPWQFQDQKDMDIAKAWGMREQFASPLIQQPTGHEADDTANRFIRDLESRKG